MPTNGDYSNPGCSVRVTCPTSTRTCTARSFGSISIEQRTGDRVSFTSRTRVLSASGSEFFSRDRTCADSRQTEDKVIIRGGETASVGCFGTRLTPRTPNRSVVKCAVNVSQNRD